ncbi:MAG: hypothetical protein OXU20_07770 [Myxococcales bacterium]|nr:hypothetical protein [Myxococcales bacterium]
MEASWTQMVAWVALTGLGASALWFVRHPRALRAAEGDMPRPYSLSRVQLFWWTMVVIACWLGVYASRGEFWQFNATCLTLLGISGGVGVAARIADARQSATGGPTPSAAASKGFLTDIMSDGVGVSVHRFQAVAFNALYGAVFAIRTFQGTGAEFPTFGSTTLLVLGMSSSAYVAIKHAERSKGEGGSAGSPAV